MKLVLAQSRWNDAIEVGTLEYSYELPSGDNHETTETVEAIVRAWLRALDIDLAICPDVQVLPRDI